MWLSDSIESIDGQLTLDKVSEFHAAVDDVSDYSHLRPSSLTIYTVDSSERGSGNEDIDSFV